MGPVHFKLNGRMALLSAAFNQFSTVETPIVHTTSIYWLNGSVCKSTASFIYIKIIYGLLLGIREENWMKNMWKYANHFRWPFKGINLQKMYIYFFQSDILSKTYLFKILGFEFFFFILQLIILFFMCLKTFKYCTFSFNQRNTHNGLTFHVFCSTPVSFSV